MKIDCRDLACPEPVLNTKKSLELLPEDSILEVLVNSVASKENVERFVQNQGFTAECEATEDGATKITIVKGFACAVAQDKSQEGLINKVLFIKDDKVGEGELGSMLAVGFIKNILELPEIPKTIICVNKGVFLTTAPKDSEIIDAFKKLEKKGVQIYSCGVCLDFYEVADKLHVGMIGNAYGTVEMLTQADGVITL